MAERFRSVSGLLRSWGRGDLQARDDLLPIVYQELGRRAAAYLRHERHARTLQPTALVHEVYLRLAGKQPIDWQSRAHFFGMAAQATRRILIDHARTHRAARPPDTVLQVTLDEPLGVVPAWDCELLARSSSSGPRVSRRAPEPHRRTALFRGLSEQEVADVFGLSPATVTRDWQTARAWLYRRITKGKRASS